MPASNTTVQFLGDWHQTQSGAIERSGRLKVEYDMQRLPHCFTKWRGAEFGNIVAQIRFHPRGEIVSGSVIAPVRDQENPPGMVIGHVPVPFEVAVPSDATQAEIWFHNFYQTSTRCDAWDSRFGQNYWFDVGGDPPRAPREPVSYRSGAIAAADMVNVTRQEIVKKNVFPQPATGSRAGTDLQTLASLTVWVRNVAYVKNVWMDLHVFDGADARIHSETFTLGYAGSAGGEADLFAFDGRIYQGTMATPGSVSPRPEARSVQYRVYYEVLGQVFTDAILHQQDLSEDAVTR